MTTPIISVQDIQSVRYRAPDLDLMESFLADFGLKRADRTANTLYMRGCGADPFVHVTEQGAPGTIGFALKAASREDLEKLARHCGAQVLPRTAPGGGWVVNLTDPDGNQVEVVHGVEPVPSSVSRTPFPANLGGNGTRPNARIRVATHPSQVLRLGHVALYVLKFKEMHAFYSDILGLRDSDTYYGGDPGNTIASFMHCGLGQKLVDHHTVALIGIGRAGFDHSAFEVLDLDDLMAGNRYLLARNRWQHSWGVGRHFEGSQIFDYWRDPFGNKIEHWTDGDQVNDEYQTSASGFNPATSLAQWGPPLSDDFMR
jgi:catechol 2,3-dioxygenase-like lactoylglutathione lyase family enzyme